MNINKLKMLVLIPILLVSACSMPMKIRPLRSESIDNCQVGCPTGGSDVTLTRETYTLNNDKVTKFADWVAYKITKNTINSGCKRIWNTDPMLPVTDTLEPEDYAGANAALNVDRGHQAPLASLCGLSDWETLNYLSNITPQKAELNQGPWAKLEEQARKLARRNDIDAVYVVTGPLYERYIGTLPGTTKEHKIPSGYYKIIFINSSPAVNYYAAFIMDQDTRLNQNFCYFQVTVAEIEKRTGLTFWTELSADMQENIKSTLGTLPAQMGCVKNMQNHFKVSQSESRHGKPRVTLVRSSR